MRVRTVITGLGVVSPLGIGVETFWSALTGGKSGIRSISRFDASGFRTQIAGEVPDFDPVQFIDKKEARRMDRYTQFAIAATGLAIEDSGLDLSSLKGERVGVILGSGIGGMQTLEDQARVLFERGPGRVSPLFVPMMIGNMGAAQISLVYGLRGPNVTVVTACASSNNAIGDACKVLRDGEADVVITGGSEAAITQLALAGFSAMKALSARNDEPEKASRPFDAGRDGFVMAEGSAIIVLETEEHAIKRGARIYAEVCGFGAAADAYHITAPDPEGVGAARAMLNAVVDAGIALDEVDYINAHGTSTPRGDEAEVKAIKKAFGPSTARIAVSSTKSMTGHLLGAAGGIEAATCALAIDRGVIPPTINYENPDPACDLDFVPNQARRVPVRVALSNAFGFGGHNATVVFRRYEGR